MTKAAERNQSKTQWHRLLGKLLEELLTPVGIVVRTGFPIMSNPPEADILLLRREGQAKWTPDQSVLLPDGVRHSPASHILLEFKYTESLSVSALHQAIGYDHFYRHNSPLKDHEIQTFLLSAKHPRTHFMTQFGYEPGEWAGVYHSQNPVLARLPILSLNALSNAEHNAYVKCFASRQNQKQQAFDTLRSIGLDKHGLGVYWFMSAWIIVAQLQRGAEQMNIELTPEQIMEIGKTWNYALLDMLPPEELLAHVTLEERLAGLQPEERLAGLQPEERLAGLTPEDLAAIEAYILQQKKHKEAPQ